MARPFCWREEGGFSGGADRAGLKNFFASGESWGEGSREGASFLGGTTGVVEGEGQERSASPLLTPSSPVPIVKHLLVLTPITASSFAIGERWCPRPSLPSSCHRHPIGMLHCFAMDRLGWQITRCQGVVGCCSPVHGQGGLEGWGGGGKGWGGADSSSPIDGRGGLGGWMGCVMTVCVEETGSAVCMLGLPL